MPQGPPIIGQCGWRGGCLAVSKALACPSNLANRDAFPAWLAAAWREKSAIALCGSTYRRDKSPTFMNSEGTLKS